jgi:hypothetical protein
MQLQNEWAELLKNDEDTLLTYSVMIRMLWGRLQREIAKQHPWHSWITTSFSRVSGLASGLGRWGMSN